MQRLFPYISFQVLNILAELLCFSHLLKMLLHRLGHTLGNNACQLINSIIDTLLYLRDVFFRRSPFSCWSKYSWVSSIGI